MPSVRRHKEPPEVFYKKGVLKNLAKFTGKHLCQSLFLKNLQVSPCNFNKKETLAQVFSREFCETSKNNFSYTEHLRWLLLHLQENIWVNQNTRQVRQHLILKTACNHNLILFPEKNCKKQAQMFYQNNSLALHTVEIFCNLKVDSRVR